MGDVISRQLLDLIYNTLIEDGPGMTVGQLSRQMPGQTTDMIGMGLERLVAVGQVAMKDARYWRVPTINFDEGEQDES